MQWLDFIFNFFKKIIKLNAFKKKYKTKNIKKIFTILKSKKWQVVDIRNFIDYNQHHLENTINVPYINFNYKFFKILDKNKKILIINNDYRSNLLIYKNLKQKGFKTYILYENYKNIRNNPNFDKISKVVMY